MRKILRLLIISVFLLTVFSASTSFAMAKSSENFELMSLNGVNFRQASCTTNSVTLSWSIESIPSNIQINEWYLIDDNNNSTDPIDRDTMTYKLTGLTSGYMAHIRLGCYCTDINTGTSEYVAIEEIYIKTKYKKSDFGLTMSGSDYKYSILSNPAVNGTEVQVAKVNSGDIIDTFDINDSYYIPINKTIAYKYRVRPYIYDTAGNKIVGAWSDYRYYNDVKATITYNNKYNGCKLKIKGVKKVSKYKIYISANSSSKGKLTKTIKPAAGKTSTYTLNKIGTKKMSRHKTYYITIVPVINGCESDIYGIVNFYNR